MAKVVLAYSGGLDTSVCIPWFKEEKGLDVVAFSADVGQGEDLGPVREKAMKTGAVSAHVVDLKERFVDEFERIPMVAPLRGGRTNMSALDLGAHRSPTKGLRGLLEDVKAGRIARRMVDRPVLRVESLRDRQVNYGFFFGAGMIHRAISLTHDLFPPGKIQGAFGAGVVTAGLILRASTKRLGGVLTPDKAQIVLDGELIPRGEFTLMIASSLQRLFLRINPFWGEEKGAVRFTAVASGAHRIAAAASGILRGKPRTFVKSDDGFTSRNVGAAQLRIDSGYTVDGEVVEPRSDEIVRITDDQRVSFVRA